MIVIHKIPGRKSDCSKAVTMVSPWWLVFYETAPEISEMEDVLMHGSAEGPPRVVENRDLLSHPDDLRKEAYLIRMT